MVLPMHDAPDSVGYNRDKCWGAKSRESVQKWRYSTRLGFKAWETETLWERKGISFGGQWRTEKLCEGGRHREDK